jgi:hypothetical protein
MIFAKVSGPIELIHPLHLVRRSAQRSLLVDKPLPVLEQMSRSTSVTAVNPLRSD